MAKHDVNTGLYLVAMVGIVAVIGLVVLVMNSGGSSMDLSTEDLSGQAILGQGEIQLNPELNNMFLPDLEVTSVALANSYYDVGSNWTVANYSVGVTNNGPSAYTPAPYALLGVDFNNDDMLTLIYSLNIPSIQPGDTTILSLNMMHIGDYTGQQIKGRMIVDPANDVTESDENNNYRVFTVNY